MNHYGIRHVANNWFSSLYLHNRLAYVSVNGFNFNLEHIHCGDPQASILGPLLFLIYINDLAIKYWSVHNFAEDTNHLNYSNSVKRMNKQVNQDLKNLTNRLNAIKIYLHVNKTEVAVLFKSSRKLTDVSLELKLNGKRLYHTNSMKYLGLKIDENLNWKQQISDRAIKLNRENAILSKLRYFIDRKTFKSVYQEIFKPHLRYSSLVWAQNLNSIKRLFALPKKLLRIIYFQSSYAHASPLFGESNILKLPDRIALENYLAINI